MKFSEIYGMKKSDFEQIDNDKLKEKVQVLKKELFDLKLSSASSNIKDNSLFKKIRIQIAQALTYLRQRENSN